MNKDKVLKIDTCCNFADVTLAHKSGPITVVYKIFLPESKVIKSGKKSMLTVGDGMNVLRDNGKDIVYIYNKHAHICNAPKNCHDFVKKLPVAEKNILGRALRLEILRNKQMPSFLVYKNLQKMLVTYGLYR